MAGDRTSRASSSIALVHYAAPPVVGGVERVLARHAILMADAGHEVTIIAGRGASPDPRVRFVPIPFVDTGHPAIVGLQAELDAGRVPGEFTDVAATIASLLAEALTGVDILIAHNICSLSLNLALTTAVRDVAGRAGAPRLILWHHDLAVASSPHRPRLHPGMPWDLLRTAWPQADHVVVSEARRAELARLTAVPLPAISVIPNGIDRSTALSLSDDTTALLARSGLADADPLLLMPSRITPRKNIEMGLRVVAAMRAAGRDAGLIVTGPVDPHQPSERDYLERLRALRESLGLEDRAWFLSDGVAVPPADTTVHDLFRAADVLFLPSRDEGFGLPILEAAVTRLPIVCADLPSLRELAGEGALYIDPDEDPATVAVRVLGRIDGDGLGRLNRKVRSLYAWETVFRNRIAPLLVSH